MYSLSQSILNPSKQLIVGACISVYMLEPLALTQSSNQYLLNPNFNSNSEVQYDLPLELKRREYKVNRNIQRLLEQDGSNQEKIPDIQFKKEKKYIKDGVRYISNKEAFINLGVDLFQLSTFIKQVGVLFDTQFNSEINDPYSENKNLIVNVKVYSSNKCSQAVEECYQLKITFHSFDKFGSEIKDFSKEVKNLPKIGFSNVKSKDVAEFQIFLNTKPENFYPLIKKDKRPLLEVSPFDVIG